jgi:chromosome condensin MukBEF MukE localization factor
MTKAVWRFGSGRAAGLRNVKNQTRKIKMTEAMTNDKAQMPNKAQNPKDNLAPSL